MISAPGLREREKLVASPRPEQMKMALDFAKHRHSTSFPLGSTGLGLVGVDAPVALHDGRAVCARLELQLGGRRAGGEGSAVVGWGCKYECMILTGAGGSRVSRSSIEANGSIHDRQILLVCTSWVSSWTTSWTSSRSSDECSAPPPTRCSISRRTPSDRQIEASHGVEAKVGGTRERLCERWTLSPIVF